MCDGGTGLVWGRWEEWIGHTKNISPFWGGERQREARTRGAKGDVGTRNGRNDDGLVPRGGARRRTSERKEGKEAKGKAPSAEFVAWLAPCLSRSCASLCCVRAHKQRGRRFVLFRFGPNPIDRGLISAGLTSSRAPSAASRPQERAAGPLPALGAPAPRRRTCARGHPCPPATAAAIAARLALLLAAAAHNPGMPVRCPRSWLCRPLHGWIQDDPNPPNAVLGSSQSDARVWTC